jgi:DNA-binding transcriptional MerR regulator
MDQLLTTSSAARTAECAESTIRLWAVQGLLPYQRTATGQRLFAQADVERVARERRPRRQLVGAE